MEKVFLIILNWNRGKTTLKCLNSLRNLKIKNFSLEIVVVDNGSTDNSVEMIRELNDSCFNFKKQSANQLKNHLLIKLILNKKNLGFAEGNNVGIRYALKNGADYVLVLNNDTTVDKNFLVQLIKQATLINQSGILGPKIYFAPGYEYHKKRYKKSDLGKVFWYAGGIIDWKSVYCFHRGVDEVDKGQYDKVEETDFVSGCAMLIKREVFEKIGLFDPRYFLYLEDTDFCLRARKAGFKIFYVPQAKVWHYNASSSAVGGDLHDYFITRNRMLFGIKYAPLKTKLALIKESGRLLLKGRKWQKIAIKDFYLQKFGKGSWKS